MQGILYEESSIWQFFFITCLLGGWAAWMTGRAVAKTWRPLATLVAYTLVLGCAVRFIHFSLFEATLLSLHYWIVDAIFVLAIGSIAYRYTRTNQMVSQYYWLYERSGPFAWRPI